MNAILLMLTKTKNEIIFFFSKMKNYKKKWEKKYKKIEKKVGATWARWSVLKFYS